MNILYGVCGVGYGHATRSSSIVKYLERNGHKVLILSHGQAYDLLKDDFNVIRIKGMDIVVQDGIVKSRDTLFLCAKHFLLDIIKMRKIHNSIRGFKPDICITDNEPFLSFISLLYRLPLITIDNQHFLTNFNHDIPLEHRSSMVLASSVIKLFSVGAKYNIVLSFYTKKPKYKHTFVVPPVIRDQIKKMKPYDGERIHVYLTTMNKNLLEVLKKTNYQYDVYGFNVIKKEGNLYFKKPETFLKDLESCKAIIATSGFSLISEAVYLGKPFFGVPVKGQFEQYPNALYLKESGFGDFSLDIKKEQILKFFSNLHKYKRNLKSHRFDYNKTYTTIDKVIHLIKKKDFSYSRKFHNEFENIGEVLKTIAKTIFSKQ